MNKVLKSLSAAQYYLLTLGCFVSKTTLRRHVKLWQETGEKGLRHYREKGDVRYGALGFTVKDLRAFAKSREWK